MKTLMIAALTALAPVAALADSVTLNTALAGATLHADTVDMTVYYDADATAFEVVAFYAPRGTTEAPQKLQMRLEDGDSVAFGLPGHTGEVFGFERTADALTITNARAQTQLAMN